MCPFKLQYSRLQKDIPDYALKTADALKLNGIRIEANLENEKIGYKIREATIRKVPYLVIIGDKESAENKLTVRKRNGENMGPFTIDELIEMIRGEVNGKQ